MRARWLALMLRRRLLRIAERRPPDFIIGGADDPYVRRWWLIPRNPVFNLYLHHFIRSDDDRALHDHPWINLSLVLSGGYAEITPGGGLSPQGATWSGLFDRRIFLHGALRLRMPRAAHRLELIDLSDTLAGDQPVWTLFVTGPRLRSWGFWCNHGWRHWRKFTAGPRGETVGRGCE